MGKFGTYICVNLAHMGELALKGKVGPYVGIKLAPVYKAAPDG
jgi:hypothetical protein